jgi:Fe-S-cluster containining protein
MEELYYRGTLTHRGSLVEFYYPAGVRWSCMECGRCCRDVEGHDRKVLLLDHDIRRIMEAGCEGFYEATGEEPFTGVMAKVDGVCVFHTPHGCAIYEDRALLCRMYPFWVERQGDALIIHTDPECLGIGEGPELNEDFYRELLAYALTQMDD